MHTRHTRHLLLVVAVVFGGLAALTGAASATGNNDNAPDVAVAPNNYTTTSGYPSSSSSSSSKPTYPSSSSSSEYGSSTTKPTYPSSSSSSEKPTTTMATYPSSSSSTPTTYPTTSPSTSPSSSSSSSEATTTTTGPTAGLFAVNVTAICDSDNLPAISIHFPPNPDLNGQVGILDFSDGTSFGPLLYVQNTTRIIPWPVSQQSPLTLTYRIMGETATATVSILDCLPPTTTVPGSTTTVAGSTTTAKPGTTTTAPTTTVPGAPTVPTVPTTPPVTVPGLPALQIGSASTVCTKDVPFVNITFGNQPEFNGIVGTISFIQLDGSFVESHQLTYQANETVTLIYPGATIDPVTGEATDWPGWKMNADGFWVIDPTDASFRDGLRVVASLPIPPGLVATAAGGIGRSRPILQQAAGETVTAETTISYPPESSACASPSGPFPPGADTPTTAALTGSLPTTGSDPWPWVIGGVAAIAAGAWLVFETRARAARNHV